MKCSICNQECGDIEMHEECYEKTMADLCETTSECEGLSDKDIEDYYKEQAKDLQGRVPLLFTSITKC